MVTPNQLTAVRIVLAFVCPALLLYQRSFAFEFIALVAFTIGCLTDWWDGYLARKRGMVTQVGALLDPIADKLLLVGLMLTFAVRGLYSVEWVIPIVVRELLVTMTRLSRLRRGQVVPAEWAGKWKVGFQIASIYATFAFLIALDSRLFDSSRPAFLFFLQSVHYVGIGLAVVFTVTSGISFFRRLDPS